MTGLIYLETRDWRYEKVFGSTSGRENNYYEFQIKFYIPCLKWAWKITLTFGSTSGRENNYYEFQIKFYIPCLKRAWKITLTALRIKSLATAVRIFAGVCWCTPREFHYDPEINYACRVFLFCDAYSVNIVHKADLKCLSVNWDKIPKY